MSPSSLLWGGNWVDYSSRGPFGSTSCDNSQLLAASPNQSFCWLSFPPEKVHTQLLINMIGIIFSTALQWNSQRRLKSSQSTRIP